MSDHEHGEDGHVQEELLEGIRHSLEALFGGLETPDSPNVTVVEGGKLDDEPRDEQDRPHLAFAPEIETPEVAFDRPSDVQVRLLKGADLFSSTQDDSFPLDGKILLNDEHPQTLYTGASQRLYRIFCQRGRLLVHCLPRGLPVRIVN